MIRQEQGVTYKALGASLLIHTAVFLTAGFFGFTAPAGLTERKVPESIDVVLYDMDALNDGPGHGKGGGGSGGSPAPETPTEVEDVVPDAPPPDVPMQAALSSDIGLKDASTTEAPQPAKPTAVQEAPTGPHTAVGGTGAGGLGTGIGTGVGSGIGPGTGSGTGGGNGSGIGRGDGSGVGDGVGGGGMRPAVPPQLLEAVTPKYPENLRRENTEGVVRVRLIVTAAGEVESAEVTESSGYPEMEEAAVNAAYGYTFKPAENSAGSPVRCAISTVIRFELY